MSGTRVRFPHKSPSGLKQRIRSADWHELSSMVVGSAVGSSQPGMSVNQSSQGTELHFQDPAMPWWGFVREVLEDVLIVSQATRGSTGTWWMESHVSRIHPAPNYTVEHFEHFWVDPAANHGDPSETDRAILVIAGFAVPDFRMLLVEPVDVEDLCEPCGDDNA